MSRASTPAGAVGAVSIDPFAAPDITAGADEPSRPDAAQASAPGNEVFETAEQVWEFAGRPYWMMPLLSGYTAEQAQAALAHPSRSLAAWRDRAARMGVAPSS